MNQARNYHLIHLTEKEVTYECKSSPTVFNLTPPLGSYARRCQFGISVHFTVGSNLVINGVSIDTDIWWRIFRMVKITI